MKSCSSIESQSAAHCKAPKLRILTGRTQDSWRLRQNDSSAVPQPTEWPRIGDWIDAIMLFAGAPRKCAEDVELL